MGTLPVLHPPTRGVGKRTQASKPLAKALRALAKALSISSARNSSLSEPKANSEERSWEAQDFWTSATKAKGGGARLLHTVGGEGVAHLDTSYCNNI